MSDEDESSQEGGEMLGGPPPDESIAGVDASDKAVSSGTAVTGGGVSLQMLQAYAARKQRVKSGASSKSSKGGRLSSSSRTRPVVKLLVTSVSRSYSEPWRRRQQRESSGTGFLIRWGNNINFVDGESATVDDGMNRTSKENNNNSKLYFGFKIKNLYVQNQNIFKLKRWNV